MFAKLKRAIFKETPNSVANNDPDKVIALIGNSEITKSKTKIVTWKKAKPQLTTTILSSIASIRTEHETPREIDFSSMSSILKFASELDCICEELPNTSTEVTVVVKLERSDLKRSWELSFFNDVQEYELENGLNRQMKKIRLG
ncbi:hypothetical protein HK098_004709 [Nowakowskiella sp. JEL0407]|nr:hypothetical protein HK098_004709 [Nowakowskiella sp. JEL0407]